MHNFGYLAKSQFFINGQFCALYTRVIIGKKALTITPIMIFLDTYPFLMVNNYYFSLYLIKNNVSHYLFTLGAHQIFEELEHISASYAFKNMKLWMIF